MVSLSQEVFELRYARMPEEPPTPVKKPVGSKLKKIRGISSESSDESSPEDTDSSSSEESESESERANQLSYLQKQVRLIFQFSELGYVVTLSPFVVVQVQSADFVYEVIITSLLCTPQVMIVHQQLAALTGKPKKKKKAIAALAMGISKLDETDPLFSPNLSPAPAKKKQKKKTVKEPVVVPAKKPPTSTASKVLKQTPQPKKTAAPSKCVPSFIPQSI